MTYTVFLFCLGEGEVTFSFILVISNTCCISICFARGETSICLALPILKFQTGQNFHSSEQMSNIHCFNGILCTINDNRNPTQAVAQESYPNQELYRSAKPITRDCTVSKCRPRKKHKAIPRDLYGAITIPRMLLISPDLTQ